MSRNMAHWYAGLQAVLLDALLVAVASACPSSSSALITCAQGTLDDLHRASSGQDHLGSLPRAVPVWLHQQSMQVSIACHEIRKCCGK